MMDLLDLAMQPSVLMMGTTRARGQFMRDLDRQRTLQMSMRDSRIANERRAYDARVRAGEKGPGGNPLRFHDSNPTDYMLNAILRDAQLQQYDANVHALQARVAADPDAPAWAQRAVLP